MKITRRMVLADLRAIVAEKGYEHCYEDEIEHRYPDAPGCLYHVGGRPACLVGQVLHRRGLLDQVGDNQAVEADHLLARLPFTDAAITLLHTVQGFQDNEWAWGPAVDYAANGYTLLTDIRRNYLHITQEHEDRSDRIKEVRDASQ